MEHDPGLQRACLRCRSAQFSWSDVAIWRIGRVQSARHVCAGHRSFSVVGCRVRLVRGCLFWSSMRDASVSQQLLGRGTLHCSRSVRVFFWLHGSSVLAAAVHHLRHRTAASQPAHLLASRSEQGHQLHRLPLRHHSPDSRAAAGLPRNLRRKEHSVLASQSHCRLQSCLGLSHRSLKGLGRRNNSDIAAPQTVNNKKKNIAFIRVSLSHQTLNSLLCFLSDLVQPFPKPILEAT
jgi:hypothetical protein